LPGAVTLVGRRRDKLEETALEVRAGGGRATIVAGDVAVEQTATEAVAATVTAYGGVDLLINNAGIHSHPSLLHETPVEEFDEFINIDLRGPFLFTRAAVPSMLERGAGVIVNISSMCGLVGFKYGTAYCVAKAGLQMLTKSTAVDYGPVIRANCICPGGMEPVERGNLIPSDYDKLIEATGVGGGMLIPTMCHVDDMAELVVFLCGPHVPTMTGAIIPVDGGYTAK
jgi:NAD(P)-dependent dehydrogenase (short-subunit alcohol dehydrogenase family)